MVYAARPCRWPRVVDAADYRAAVVRLARHYGWRRGAELGVGSGFLSRRLLERCPDLEHLTGVDTLRRPDRAARCRALESEFPGRYTLLPVTTVQAATTFRAHTLDFIFIDAGHSYEAVRDDIAAWRHTVLPGGAILGHDYGHPKYPGVAQAADEAFDLVEVLGHTIWAVAC